MRNRDEEAASIAADDPTAARPVVARDLQAVAQWADQSALDGPGACLTTWGTEVKNVRRWQG
jgi:hypothetical protein